MASKVTSGICLESRSTSSSIQFLTACSLQGSERPILVINGGQKTNHDNNMRI